MRQSAFVEITSQTFTDSMEINTMQFFGFFEKRLIFMS